MAPFTIACACRALLVLALAAACAQCGASCVDNNEKIINLFGAQGVTVSGCTDALVKADCGAAIPEDAIPSRTTKVVCCNTCFEINAPGLKKRSGVQYTTAYGLPWVLDIVEPEDTGVVLPLAVIVHGGGFKGGARISNEVWAIDWANRGYRVINVDYPLCKHYWRGTDQQQHPWGATAALTGPAHSDCDGGQPDAEAPAWFGMNMAEVASRAVRHAVKWAHNEGSLKIDTANTVCHGSSAGSLTCLQTFLYNTTVSYANELAATEQAAAGLPQQTNLLAPDPGLDYIKLAAHVGMSFGDLRNITQETVDAMAPGASAWVIHDWKDEWPAVTGLQGQKMAGVRNLGRMLDEFGVNNTVYVLDDPGMPRGPPGNPYTMKQHGLDLEKTLQGDVLEGMHSFVAQGLASATRDPAPGATSPTGQTTTQPTGQTTQPTPGEQGGKGYNCLFIGHSFFIPIAAKLAPLAAAAGLVNHTETGVFSGGATGSPLALWNNAALSDEIKEELDTGGVELFGMTFEGSAPTTEGYERWIEYALSKNNDTIFMVGIPWKDFPASVDTANYTATIRTSFSEAMPALFAGLRAKFPGTTIIENIYGTAAVELRLLFDQGKLPESDIKQLTGDRATSLFKDNKGHAGVMLLDLASLFFLKRIYGVGPSELSSNFSAYSTDIKAVAQSVLDAQDAQDAFSFCAPSDASCPGRSNHTQPTGQTTQPTGQTTQPTGQTTQPTGQTSQPTVCTDNDAAIIALAAAAGHTVTGCADVKVVQHCSEYAQVPIKCCASCAADQSSSSAPFAASLGGNPFAGDPADPDGRSSACATQHRGMRLISVTAAVLAANAALCT